MTGANSPLDGSLRAPGSSAAQSSSSDTHAHSAREAAEARGRGPGQIGCRLPSLAYGTEPALDETHSGWELLL